MSRDPLHEQRQVIDLVLVDPEDLDVWDGGEDCVRCDFIAVQHQRYQSGQTV